MVRALGKGYGNGYGYSTLVALGCNGFFELNFLVAGECVMCTRASCLTNVFSVFRGCEEALHIMIPPGRLEGFGGALANGVVLVAESGK